MKVTIIDNVNAIAELPDEIVRGILADLTDRRGLRQAWESIDGEVEEEILSTWAGLVEEALRRNLMSPEDLAMLQALYSRSPKSVVDHLEKVKKAGSGKFMDNYFVGYGHASIGDCGSTTIFVEGVTMLVAKAIQDWPLYSGQEASTRYMDFAGANAYDPVGTSDSEEILGGWFDFYARSRERLIEHLRAKYPRQPDEKESTYDRAIAARSFDIMRGFLPAGARTNLSWSTNLRQAGDKLRWLAEHPCRQVREASDLILDLLRDQYPHSFGEKSLKANREGVSDDRYRAVSAYVNEVMNVDYFLRPEASVAPIWPVCDDKQFSHDEMRRHGVMLKHRPRGAELPHWLGELGHIRSRFALDFGSYRDLQRHRNGTIRMPLLSTKLGFHPWYLDELPPDLREEAEGLIETQSARIDQLPCGHVDAQNYVAMGSMVPCRVTQTLPAFVYRLELRSGKTIHPTLRNVILGEVEWFRDRFPDVALYVDTDPDSWTVRRGSQTIEER